MILTGKVIAVESRSEFTDKHRRIKVRVLEADNAYGLIRLNDDDGIFALDDELQIDLAVRGSECSMCREAVAPGTYHDHHTE